MRIKPKKLLTALLSLLCAAVIAVSPLAEAIGADAGAPPDTETAELMSVIMASGSCGADSPEDLIWTLDDSGLLTFRGSGPMADYEETSDGRTTAPWAAQSDNIISVEIPAGVTSVGDFAFFRCYDLRQATVADGVTSIGNSAFYDCYALESLTLPQTITAIGERAFGYCFSLRYLAIPDSVTHIGTNAFYGCSSLSSLTIPESVTAIGENAFYDCPELILNVYEGSYAQRYALLNSIKHETISDMPDDPDPATTFVVTFDANGGTGATSTLTVKEGESFYMPRCTFAPPEGMTFRCWLMDDGREAMPGDSCVIQGDVVVVAQWESVDTTDPDPTPTSEGLVSLSILDAQVFPADTTTYDPSAPSAASLTPGGIVVLTLGLENVSSVPVTIASFYAKLLCIGDMLEVGDMLEACNLFDGSNFQVNDALFGGNDEGEGRWTYAADMNPEKGYVSFSAFCSDNLTLSDYAQVALARCAFRVKSGVTEGVLWFGFDEKESYVLSPEDDYLGFDSSSLRILISGGDDTPAPDPTPTPGPVNVPTMENLSYTFANSREGFGYANDYRIPLERYERVFGGKVLSKTLYKLAGLWGGNCYGVSTTSAFFHANADIDVTSFNANADAPVKLKLTDKSTTLYISLQEFIELMQVSQNASVIQNAYRTHKNQLAELCDAVDEFAKTGQNPVVIAAFGPQGGHALLGYKLESVSGTQSRLYVYDSNFPQNAERYLTLSVDAEGTPTSWYYHLNDKYDWGSAFPNCWISFIPYADYCQVWDERAATNVGTPSKLELLTVSDDARIYDADGMPIATIQDGELITGRNDMFPMITLGLTADSDGEQPKTAAVWVPTDLYTVERVAAVSSGDGPKLLGADSFKASVTHEEQSADVSTTASKVTFAVDDASKLNMVVIDEQQEGELYEITLLSSLESAENEELRLTGTVLSKALTFMQLKGEMLYSGITAGNSSTLATGITLSVDGEDSTPQSASAKSKPMAIFSSNGGEGAISPIEANANGAFTLPECSFKAPSGKMFDCWLVNQKKYQPGQTCIITETAAVVAQWKTADSPAEPAAVDAASAHEYALDKLTRNGDEVSVRVTNRSGAGGLLMIAAYSENGKFLRYALDTIAESRIAKGKAAVVSVKLNVSGAQTLRAVMLDANTQKPLSPPASA